MTRDGGQYHLAESGNSDLPFSGLAADGRDAKYIARLLQCMDGPLMITFPHPDNSLPHLHASHWSIGDVSTAFSDDDMLFPEPRP